MVDQATVERALRRAHEAGDVEAARTIARGWQQQQQQQQQVATPPLGLPAERSPMTPQSIAQDTMRLEQQAMDTAERRGLKGVREVTADAARMAGPMVGTALGAPFGLGGMVVGGAGGGVGGEWLGRAIEGSPAPTTSETVGAAVGGGASGLTGGLAGKGVNALARAFQSEPGKKLSVQAADAVRKQAGELGGGNVAQGFKAARAAKSAVKKLQDTGQPIPPELAAQARLSTDYMVAVRVVPAIEKAISASRGNPTSLRLAFNRLINTKMFDQLTGEQQAMIINVTKQNTASGVLKSIGDLKFALGSVGGGAMLGEPVTGGLVAGGMGAARLAGSVMDRSATNRLAGAALHGISGIPAANAAPPFLAPFAAGVAQPVVDPKAKAVLGALGAPRR